MARTPPCLALLLLAAATQAEAQTLYADIPGTIDVTTPAMDMTKEPPYSEVQAGTPDEAGSVAIELSTAEDTSSWATVTLRLCYAPVSQVNRKWRKAKPTVEGNNACKQPGLKKIATIPWEAGTTTLEYTFQPDPNVAAAVYFVEALAQDAEGAYLAKGSTGETGPFFQVLAWAAVDTGLIAAASVLSVLSWTSFIAYFVKDFVFTKPKKTVVTSTPSFVDPDLTKE